MGFLDDRMARRDVRDNLIFERIYTEKASINHCFEWHNWDRCPDTLTSAPTKQPLPKLITFAATISPISSKSLLHGNLFSDHSFVTLLFKSSLNIS